jgi:hypothetical protein
MLHCVCAQSQLRIVVPCPRLCGHWHDFPRGIGGRRKLQNRLASSSSTRGAIVAKENILADCPFLERGEILAVIEYAALPSTDGISQTWLKARERFHQRRVKPAAT